MAKEYLFALAGLVAGLVLGFLISSIGIGGTKTMTVPGIQNGGMMSGQDIDAHFIEQMIPHHEDAVTMSRLALQKARTPEVRTLSQNIIDSQSAEIEQMKSWYKQWYGRELPTGDQVMKQHGMMSGGPMHMGMKGDQEDLTDLENAEDFDRAFIEMMIPHHQMAIMMASMLKNGTERPEMKQLADNIISSQSGEIDQMRSWLKNW